ncbi:YadA-like family protein [Bartonella sp. DGB1]|uniref:YadA-like family protein n=1 Tax=Bartonella sp. DGB1 TaxID=3239807 RepID=UPI003525B9D3
MVNKTLDNLLKQKDNDNIAFIDNLLSLPKVHIVDDEIFFGQQSLARRLTNVAEGESDTDVMNVGQLNKKVKKIYNDNDIDISKKLIDELKSLKQQIVDLKNKTPKLDDQGNLNWGSDNNSSDENIITNVYDPKHETDLMNKGTLDRELDTIEKNLKDLEHGINNTKEEVKGTSELAHRAAAMQLASNALPNEFAAGGISFAIAAGYWEKEMALAAGVSYRTTSGKTSMKASLSSAIKNMSFGINFGINYHF